LESDWGDLFSESSAETEQNGQANEFQDLFAENSSASEMEFADMFQSNENEAKPSEASSNGHLELDAFADLFGEENSNNSALKEEGHKEEKI
jgi:hypothetical protein